MASVSVQDRWFRKVKHPDGRVERLPTDRNGVGLRWRVRWRDDQDREQNESYARKADADDRAVKVEADLLAATYVDPRSGRQSFRAYAESWLRAQNHDTSTKVLYDGLLRLHVFPAFRDGAQQIGAVRHSHARAAVTRWERSLGQNRARQCHSLARTIFRAAVLDELITKSPFRGIRLPPVYTNPDRYIPESLDDLVPALEVLPADLEALMTIAAGSGLRLSEVLGLDADADLTWLPKGEVVVRRQLGYVIGRGHYFADPKTPDGARTVPLPGFVMTAIAAHMQAHPPAEVTLPWGAPDVDEDEEHQDLVTVRLLFHRDGRPVVRNTVTNRISARLRRAKLEPGLTPHVCRHLYESMLHDEGIPQIAIDSYMGHVPVGSIGRRRYQHVMRGAPDRVRDALETLWAEAGVARVWPDEIGQAHDLQG